MKIQVRNMAGLPNKHVRFIKWKLYGLRAKFKNLHYAEVFLRTEGTSPAQYHINVRLGIPGNDIILKDRSPNLYKLLYSLERNAHRNLADRA